VERNQLLLSFLFPVDKLSCAISDGKCRFFCAGEEGASGIQNRVVSTSLLNSICFVSEYSMISVLLCISKDLEKRDNGDDSVAGCAMQNG